MAVVLIPESVDVDRHVVEAMEPYSEHTSRSGWWDWWQIGGRWTGIWSEDYDPHEDPANHQQCELCGGSGFRKDLGRKCNGCGYGWSAATPGIRLKWPTAWARHDGDVVSVKTLLDHFDEWGHPFAFISPNSAVEREAWDGKQFVPTEGFVLAYRQALEAHPDMFAVVVDYHS